MTVIRAAMNLLRPLRAVPWLVLALAAQLLAGNGHARAAGVAPGPGPASTLRSLAASPRFAHARWGIHVVDQLSGAVLWSTNEAGLFMAASTAKLFTGALALDRLGEHFRIRTSVFARSAPDSGGILRGDLVVYGRGDFSFAARFREGQVGGSLARLVTAIRQSGVREIRGRLIGDATWIGGPPYGWGWAWEDLQHAYGAPISGLNVEDNTVDLTLAPAKTKGRPGILLAQPAWNGLEFVNRTSTSETKTPINIRVYRAPGESRVIVDGQIPLGSSPWAGDVSVPRPGLWFGQLLQTELAAAGIRVREGVISCEWPEPSALGSQPPMRELAFTDSPPLRDLLKHTLKTSQNQYAQLLWLTAAAAKPPSPGLAEGGSGLTSRGATNLGSLLDRVGIPRVEAQLQEGAGLARESRVSPRALTALLRWSARRPYAQAWRDALPIAGKDGTLARRFGRTSAEGNLVGKTGSLSGVCCLAGYVTNRAGRPLVFALMLEDGQLDGSDSARDAIDALAIAIAESTTAAP